MSRRLGIPLFFGMLLAQGVRLFAQDSGSDSAAFQRAELLRVQAEVRTIAFRQAGTTLKKNADFYTAELETENADLLQAHLSFEKGAVLELQGSKPKAQEAWNEAASKLAGAGQSGKPWLRRVHLALLTRQITDLHHKNDFPAVVSALKQANDVINANPLPNTADTLRNQAQVEQWMASGLLIADALKSLEGSSGNHAAQMDLLERTLHQIGSAWLFFQVASAQEAPRTQEALVDRIVFKEELSGLFTSLFYNFNRVGRDLPTSTQAVWTALLAAWATDAPNEHYTPSALDERNLSPLDKADQFRALAAASQILNGYNLRGANEKLAKGLSFLKPADCPADATALAIADVLIEGGLETLAFPYLEKAEKGGLKTAAESRWVKALFRMQAYQKAIERGRAALPTSAGSAEGNEILFWTAKALLKTGRQVEARDEFRKCFETDPGSRRAPEACLLTGMLSFNLGQISDATHFLQQTRARYPSSKEGLRAAEILTDQ